MSPILHLKNEHPRQILVWNFLSTFEEVYNKMVWLRPKQASQKLIAALEEELYESHFAVLMLDCLSDAIFAFETGRYYEDYDFSKQYISWFAR